MTAVMLKWMFLKIMKMNKNEFDWLFRFLTTSAIVQLVKDLFFHMKRKRNYARKYNNAREFDITGI